MPGSIQTSSMIHILKLHKARSANVKDPRKIGLALSTKRHGNPAILESFGNNFKDAFGKAKQKEGKKALEGIEESSVKKNISEDPIDQENVQSVIEPASQAPEEEYTSAENVSKVFQQNYNTTYHIADDENVVQKNGASPASSRSSKCSIEEDGQSRQMTSTSNEVKETANGDQASDRISFLESEVATYESLVTSKDNEIQGIQEDHEAEVEELQERLASTEARLTNLEASLAKETASKNRIMGQHNELKMQNKELNQQLGTGKFEAVQQLQTENKERDEMLAAARAKERKLISDGGFWQGAFLLTAADLEDANPDVAQRYNGIVRRKDEQIDELTEELSEAQEQYRIEYAGRVDDRTKHFGTVAGLRKWERDIRNWCHSIAGTYGTLQGHVNHVINILNGLRSKDDCIASLLEACNGIKVENAKLSQARHNYDQQVVAQSETIAERDAKIIELEAALAHEQQQHAFAKRVPGQIKRELELQGIGHESVVQEWTVKVQELENSLQKQVEARESLAQDVINGTAAQTIVNGLNDQMLGLRQDVTDSKRQVKYFSDAYAHVHGELRELRGVGKWGSDFDVNLSGADFQDIANYQIELLRRRVKIAEAPLQADLGKFRDKVERKGGILAAWGIQYEVDEADTE